MTGPLLIYHSEIEQTVSNNSLTCSHTTGPVAWYLAVKNTRLTTDVKVGTFLNVISNNGRQAQIRRGTKDLQEPQFDGLWTCRLNGTTGAGAFHVGIYDDNFSSKITLKYFLSRLTSQRYILFYLSCCNICTLSEHVTVKF